MKIIDRVVIDNKQPENKNVIWIDKRDGSSTQKYYMNGKWNPIDSESTTSIQKIKYSDLKHIRDNGNLKPGQFYRITDYQCTTTTPNTQSAGHVFDIIVRADDESHFNENAFATYHEGDTYFENAHLEAWELKYCIDNDTARFEWADAENGKGIIYYMKDEFGNECHYDFKNIMFKRFAIVDFDDCPDIEVNSPNNPQHFYYGAVNIIDQTNTIQGAQYSDEYKYYYTFVNQQTLEDESIYHSGFCGSIQNAFDDTGTLILNNNVICDQSSVTISEKCMNNTIGQECQACTFDESCFGNVLCNNCNSTIFNDACNSNILGANSMGNIFQTFCSNNILKTNCPINIFGKYCDNNKFGMWCTGNQLGTEVYNNQFGNMFSSNVLYNQIENCVFGAYLNTGTVEACKYVNVEGGISGSGISYWHVLSGTQGTNQQLLQIQFIKGKSYPQFAGRTSSLQLKIWNPADLVQ